VDHASFKLSNDPNPSSVFAVFRPAIRIIDHDKRAVLHQQLLQSVTSTAPGEKLDEKLAALTFGNSAAQPNLPPPSTDETAWWDVPGRPEGKFPTQPGTRQTQANPFDSSDSSTVASSPSSSDDELYNHAQKLQTPIMPAQKAAPPPPPPQPAIKIIASGDSEEGT